MSTRRAQTLVLCLASALTAQGKVDYPADVKFAIEAIGKHCKVLLAAKEIDWKKVTAPLLAESKKVRSHESHLLLLWRLLARLRDGHAEVQPLDLGKGVKVEWPDRSHGPGLFLCHVGQRVFVKNAWGPAAAAGLETGMEVVTLDDLPARDWLQRRSTQIADLVSFSTPQQAAFYTAHQGLADGPGTRLEVVVMAGSSKKKRTVGYTKVNQTPSGPAFVPAGVTGTKDVFHGKSEAGFGYVHVRRCKDDLPQQMDQALAGIGAVPGLILDFRGNSGGGFDHEALFGRFVPKGHTWNKGARYESAGAAPYGGPIVVIVDASVRSAGETAAGMLLEDGRAFGIGESATAGMSSQKTTIELPSKLFALYVSVGSNKQRFHGGKGIEGIGVVPHELVPFDPDDLRRQRDTLIRRADALLRAFPQDKVDYDPARHGWSSPK